MNRKGSLLVEFLIYLGILTFLTTLLFSFILDSQKKSSYCMNNSTQITAIWMVQELITRDLRAAPINLNSWKKLESKDIICSFSGKDICWQEENGILLRISGNFNTNTQQWIKKFKSVALKNVEFKATPLIQENRIEALLLEIRSNGSSSSWLVRPRIQGVG